MAIFLRRCRFVLVLGVLLLAIWLGLKEGLGGIRSAASNGQRVAATCQVLYGILAAVSLVALFTRRRWLPAALLGWVVTISLTGGLAPVVWGGTGWQSGAVAGGGTAVVATLIAWGALAHARSLSGAAAPQQTADT